MPFIPMEERAMQRANRNTMLGLLRGVGRMEDDFDPQEDYVDVYIQRLHSIPRLQRAWANLSALQKDAVVFLMSRPEPVPEEDFQTWAKNEHNIRGAELNKLVSQLLQRAWMWTMTHHEDKAFWAPMPVRAWWSNTTLQTGGPLEGGEHLNGSLLTDSLILWSLIEQMGCRGVMERKSIRWYKKDLEILAARLYPGVKAQTSWLSRQRIRLLLDTFVQAGWWRLDEKGLSPNAVLDIPLLAAHLGEAILQTMLSQRLSGAVGGAFWAIQSLEGEVELPKVLDRLEKSYGWGTGDRQEVLELFGSLGAALGWRIGDLSFESIETGAERTLLRWLGSHQLNETRAPGVVQPNFEILISSKAPPRQLYRLLTICRLKANDNYFTLHLDREHMARTMAGGLTLKQITDTLTGVGQREIPQNVAYTIKDWVRTTIVIDETEQLLVLPDLKELGDDMSWVAALKKVCQFPAEGGQVNLEEKVFAQALKVLRDRHVSLVPMPYPMSQRVPKMKALFSPWRLAEDAPEDPHHSKLKDFLRKHRAEAVSRG